MNNSNIQTIIQDHMKTLPPDVAEAIRGSLWERKILNIGRKYGLHVDQLEILQTELSLAVLGLSGRDEFVRQTMHEAKIDKQMMNSIVADINHEIFEPIRDHLRKTRQQQEEREIHEEVPLASGLLQHEEDTLKRHGVSFDLHEEQEIPKIEPFVEIQKKEVSSPEALILAQPLRLSKEKKAKQSTDFESIIAATRVRAPEKPEIKQDLSSEKKEVSQDEVLGLSLDPQTLPSKKTQENQKIITSSRAPLYQGSDPYREPIE